jgi:hypothetical protein
MNTRTLLELEGARVLLIHAQNIIAEACRKINESGISFEREKACIKSNLSTSLHSINYANSEIIYIMNDIENEQK